MAMTWEDWLKLAGTGAGIGLNIYGTNQANNATNQQNQRIQTSQDQLLQQAAQERQRRDAMTSLFLPSLLRDMRIKANPNQLGSLYRQAGQSQPQAQPIATGQQPTAGLLDDEWMKQFGPNGTQTGGSNRGLT